MIAQRVRKSEKLSKDFLKKLEKFIKAKGTILDAAEKIGISRITLSNVRKNGSCKPETNLKLKAVLENE